MLLRLSGATIAFDIAIRYDGGRVPEPMSAAGRRWALAKPLAEDAAEMGRVAESPLVRDFSDLQIFRFAADKGVSTAQQTLLPDPA